MEDFGPYPAEKAEKQNKTKKTKTVHYFLSYIFFFSTMDESSLARSCFEVSLGDSSDKLYYGSKTVCNQSNVTPLTESEFNISHKYEGKSR